MENNTFLTTAGTNSLTALALFGNAALTLSNSTLIVEPVAATRAAQLQVLQSEVITGRTASQGILSAGLAGNLALAVIDNSTLAKPFTTFKTVTVDTNAILISPELLGDANADGKVDAGDLNTVLTHLGTTAPNWTPPAILAGQATLDLTDLNDVLNNLGSTFATPSPLLPTPEPASLTLVSLTAPLLLARLKKA